MHRVEESAQRLDDRLPDWEDESAALEDPIACLPVPAFPSIAGCWSAEILNGGGNIQGKAGGQHKANTGVHSAQSNLMNAGPGFAVTFPPALTLIMTSESRLRRG